MSPINFSVGPSPLGINLGFELGCTELGLGVIGTKGLGPGPDNKRAERELRKSSETDQEQRERANRELKIAITLIQSELKKNLVNLLYLIWLVVVKTHPSKSLEQQRV